jgi:hypothetical protein
MTIWAIISTMTSLPNVQISLGLFEALKPQQF